MPEPENNCGLQPEITFWKDALVINGILEGEKAALPVRKFNGIYKTNPRNSAVEAGFRLAYGTDFLYVLLQIEKEKITCRDRGYQNGDGMLVTLAAFQPGKTITNEYSLFGFWPQQNGTGRTGKRLWGYNGDWPLRDLDESTQFVAREQDGRIIFELLLPWKEAFPYHPWLAENIGFDLMYSEAVGEGDVNTHILAYDETDTPRGCVSNIRLEFEKPVLEKGTQTYLACNRNESQGEDLALRVVTLAAEACTEELALYTLAGEGLPLSSTVIRQTCAPGLTAWDASLPASNLLSGGYQIRWLSRNNPSAGVAGFSLLPRFDIQTEQSRLNCLEGKLPSGTLNTLAFRLQNLQKELSRIKPYELCPRQRIEVEKYLNVVREVESGTDCIAGGRGILRRAFRSKLDGTLQPYSIKIPEDYDPNRRYPLLVFLHGSDRDDTELAGYQALNALTDWIVLTPFARGMVNYYTTDHAQEDIQEAIHDVCLNYSIDERHMVIAGFSMGGYGTYRTYYETPDRYIGAAVFAGLPRLTDDYFPGAGSHPNFLENKYLEPFKNARMFIFHGTGDHNTPFPLTVQVVDQLRAIGAQVVFRPQEGTGHAEPNEENAMAFFHWMDDILKSR